MYLIFLAALQIAVPSDLTGIYSRIDSIGRYPGQAAMCMRIGYTVEPDFAERLKERAINEGELAGASSSLVSSWLNEGASRSRAVLESRRSRAMAVIESDEDPTAAIKELYSTAFTQCAEMIGDPILAGLIAPPDDPVAARIHAEDQLLAGFGTASWQTPRIWALGELVMVIGACKGQLSARRHNELWNSYLSLEASEQVKSWIQSKYVDGLRSEVELGLDLAQCNRVIGIREEELSRLGR